jgi:hypothetical protein
MEKQRVNTLYSILISLGDRMVFEDYFTDMMRMGFVEVNDKKVSHKCINESMYVGDKIA